MKALQARLLSSGLCTRFFNSGCLRSSLEQAHSFSLLWAPCLLPAGLSQGNQVLFSFGNLLLNTAR